MRSTVALIAVLTLAALGIAFDAFAQSPVFRQSIREVRGEWRAFLPAGGGVEFETTCTVPEQETVDGGSWPLKFTVSNADGGNPTQVIRACVTQIERRNGLDGGPQ